MTEKKVSRRGFLNVAISAIVAGVVAGVGGYYAGLLSAPPPTAPLTTTVTVPGPTTTVTRTTTVTVTATTTPTPPKELATIRVWYIVPVEELISLLEIPYIRENALKNYGKAYKLEFGKAQASPMLITGLAAGEIDIAVGVAHIAFSQAIINQTVPGGITAIATDFYDAHPNYYSFTWLTLYDSPITGVKDLKRKTLGVNAFGTGVHATALVTLKKYGMDPKKDVNFVEIPFPNMAAAVKEKKIDAGVFPSTFYYRALFENPPNTFKKVFDSYEGYGRPYLHTMVVARNDFLKKQPEATRAFLEDYVLLHRYVYAPENRDRVIELVAEQFKLSKDMLKAYYLLPGKDVYRPLDGRIVVEDLQWGVSKLYEIGFIDRDLQVAPYVDNSYL
ncbi:MAG: ABC transporter substrate-binding protein, partial [Nitrososphaerota archaeon]